MLSPHKFGKKTNIYLLSFPPFHCNFITGYLLSQKTIESDMAAEPVCFPSNYIRFLLTPAGSVTFTTFRDFTINLMNLIQNGNFEFLFKFIKTVNLQTLYKMVHECCETIDVF